MITINFEDLTNDGHTRKALLDISLSVTKSRKIVVVTGAGISCSCGIPDFRSSDGLYALVKQQYPDVVLKGRDLFDAALFRDPASRAVFYTFISQLKQSVDAASPSPTHHFIKTLDTKNKLLRSYTQNIDGLEARAGLLGTSEMKQSSATRGKPSLKDVRNVQLHGDIHRVQCVACSAEYACTTDHTQMFDKGTPPECPDCLSRSAARVARSARPIRVGTLRPAIVLYDEPHPHGDEIGAIQSADIARKPDLLIIMGTSLKVHGLKKLVKEFAKTVQASTSSTGKASKKAYKVIFVNKTPPSSDWEDIIDCHIAGETDEWVTKVIEDWKKLKPVDWEVQQTLVSIDNVTSMKGGFKVTKKSNAISKKKTKQATEENIGPIPDESHTKGRNILSSPNKRTESVAAVESKTEGKQRSAELKPEERKPLFAETTNNDLFELHTTFEMECSLADLSMRDVEPIETIEPKPALNETVKPRPRRGKAVECVAVAPSKARTSQSRA